MITSSHPVPAGEVTLAFEFISDGGTGAGGTGRLFINGQAAGEGRIARTESFMFATDDESFDVGMDTGTPVSESYQVPFKLQGKIEKLNIELSAPVSNTQETSSDKLEQ